MGEFGSRVVRAPVLAPQAQDFPRWYQDVPCLLRVDGGMPESELEPRSGASGGSLVLTAARP